MHRGFSLITSLRPSLRLELPGATRQAIHSWNIIPARLPALALIVLTIGSLASGLQAVGKREERPQEPTIPTYNPAKQPTTVGEVPVGVVTITFRETEVTNSISRVAQDLNTVKGASSEADLGGHGHHGSDSEGVSQEEYFKIYSNGITWPKIVMMPDESTVYQDPHFYGYYCEYDYWENPIGWQSAEEANKRVEKMNRNALRFAEKNYRGPKPRFVCYNYITTRPETPSEEVHNLLLHFYQNRGDDPDRTRKIRTRKVRRRDQQEGAGDFDPWRHYTPAVKWGEPMWPNSKIQINNSAGGVLAHEIGHCLGAPDVYRIGRYNDGIGGGASLLSYGPTANAFSRFYHHGYIKQENHPVIEKPGNYTLHPRHIDPKGEQAIGYLIPSNHPHYMYHLEYIHDENSTVGVGPQPEGLLVSVVNLGRDNYLGSPDYFYTYRPNDPFFRGEGHLDQCLFGKSHGRTAFGPDTEPSSRLPNLLDGGIRIKNIEERQGSLTFDLEIERQRVAGREYTESMLPQIRLDQVVDVQPTSFTMDCTIKFRGEPLKTDYGFCWATSRNPTIRDSTYNLRHRECYRGHAIHLSPNTTYYIRAYATNGLGVRYSDEEITIKTPPLTAARYGIGPLCTDSFSNNAYLFTRYSNETNETSETFIGYSPTCVLAKLTAYYRPKRFPSARDDDSRPEAVDFDRLNWNPGGDHHPPRLDEIDGFFRSVYDQSLSLKLHEPKPSKQFLSNLVKLTKARSKPVLNTLDAGNLSQVASLIQKDLAQSRPVIVIFSFENGDATAPARWALIDGIDASGRFLVDFPMNTNMFVDGEDRNIRSGPVPAEALLLPFYKTHVITSCYHTK
jgi:hypothetical protein